MPTAPRALAPPGRESVVFELARRALLAAIEVALSARQAREERAGLALRMLRRLCFEASPTSLIGLTFPLGGAALVECLERPCGTWLPFADELGVADERLLVLGWPTVSCREIALRLARP